MTTSTSQTPVCAAVLFSSAPIVFNELSLTHLRYYLPHSSTKWVVEASLPYVDFKP